MDDATLDLNARLAAVENQRNAALTQAAILAGQIMVLKRQLSTLAEAMEKRDAEIAELKEKQQCQV